MPTNTDRIAALETDTNALKTRDAVLSERVESLSALTTARFQQVAADNERLRTEVTQLKADDDTLRAADSERGQRVALLDSTVKELKAVSERWGQCWWQLAAGIALALLGGAVGYLSKR